MISSLKTNKYLELDNRLSGLIKKNIFFGFLLKGGSVIVGLLLVPMTIDYINPVQYGIWLTISSIVGWINFFDIGLANGLRNKVTTLDAVGEDETAARYVSTTYLVLSIIAISIFTAFYLLSSLFNWNNILNVPESFHYDLRPVLLFVVGAFCIQFVVQTINTILTALHQSSKSAIITFFGQLGVLMIIYFVRKVVPGNLNTLVLVLMGFPIVVLIFASVYFFRTTLSRFKPKISNINITSIRSLFNTGAVFFFIQIGSLVLFQTDNIIITRIFGPEAVTTFNISYKLFSVPVLIFGLIITPYWSAFSEAYAKNDIVWIKAQVARIRKVWLAISIVAIMLYFLSPLFYRFWIGDKVLIPSSLSLAMAVYVIAYTWQTLHVYFLNGIEKIKLQLLLVSLSVLVNIPLAFYLGKKIGLSGIVTANTAVFFIMGIFFSLQYKKIINNRAFGIWNK